MNNKQIKYYHEGDGIIRTVPSEQKKPSEPKQNQPKLASNDSKSIQQKK